MTTDHPCANCKHPDAHSSIVGCLADGCDCQTYARPDVGRTIPSRNADPETAKVAAKVYAIRKGNQRTRLLEAFAHDDLNLTIHRHPGLTDEEAMEHAAGVSPLSEYAKRCSELRDGGFIEPTGETRKGGQGIPRLVSRITDKGLTALASL